MESTLYCTLAIDLNKLSHPAIYYRGKVWQQLTIAGIEAYDDEDIIPMGVYFICLKTELIPDMEKVLQDLLPLKEELRAAKMFLKNMFSFMPSIDMVKASLGRTLGQRMATEMQNAHGYMKYVIPNPNKNHMESFKTFVSMNEDVIRIMNERVMINLVV